MTTRTALETGSVGIGVADEPNTRAANPQPLGGEYEGLKERLAVRSPVGPIDNDGVAAGGWRLANPDGPEAAKAITDLEERLSRAEGALVPFARVLAMAGDDTDVPDGASLTNSNVMASMLFYGDFRAAARALKTEATEPSTSEQST